MTEKTIIQLGKMVKSFTLQDQFGQNFILSKMRGHRVLLSFHPLAWTPVCTLQMQSLEKNKKIFDKLEKGIAIIAIQKNKGRDDGLGGARSIEKARLYLSMRPGVIKIVKAKNWVSGTVNPNGLEKQFKLAKGMIFADASNWVKADGD